MSPTADPAGRAALLELLVRSEVTPRLGLPRRHWTTRGHRLPDPSPAIADFTAMLRTQEAHVALAHIEAMRLGGASMETIYISLLAPTAQRLRGLWIEERCDVADLRVGLWRLQLLLYALDSAFQQDAPHREGGPSVLLGAVSGEVRTVESLLAEAFFRRAGWRVCAEPRHGGRSLVSIVRQQAIDVVWLSATWGSRLEGLSRLIRAVRRASLNPSLGVVVGGYASGDAAELVRRVGAHAMSVDGRHAVSQAQGLVTMLSQRQAGRPQ